MRCLNAHDLQGRIKKIEPYLWPCELNLLQSSHAVTTLEAEDLLCFKRHSSHQMSHDFPLTSSKHLPSYNLRPPLVLHSQQHPQPSITLPAHKHTISTFASEKRLCFSFFPWYWYIHPLFCMLLTTPHIRPPTTTALGLSKAAFCAYCKLLRYNNMAAKEQREDKINKQTGKTINNVSNSSRQLSPTQHFLAVTMWRQETYRWLLSLMVLTPWRSESGVRGLFRVIPTAAHGEGSFYLAPHQQAISKAIA